MLAMLCTYYTYRNLPIAFATSIGMTSAIFTTALSGLILKEVIGYKKWGLVILGYIGALIVIKPTIFILDTAVITALLANLLAATCIIIIKILSKKNSIITIMLVGNVGIFTVSFLMNHYSMTSTKRLRHGSTISYRSFGNNYSAMPEYCDKKN